MTDARPPLNHVILIDGTLASLVPGSRSSIGRIYAALSGWWGPLPQRVRVRYIPGLQWDRWRDVPELVIGTELEARIRETYGWLARTWQQGDRLFFFGYSRGAFAVRSLAGLIGRVGLLRPERATDQNILQAWQYYQQGGDPDVLAAFRETNCHPSVPIRMIGAFDTVMALGIRLPVLWMLSEGRYRFHDQHLGPDVQLGVQALALDETRAAFNPILWTSDSDDTRLQQMWFRGCHPDIGGQLAGAEFARPLSNIPLVWMLGQAEKAGLPLPKDWRGQLPCDPTAPSIGSWRGWGKAFLARAPRIVGSEPSEELHPSVPRPYSGPAILTDHLANEAARPLRQRHRAGKTPRPAVSQSDEQGSGDLL